MPALQSSFPAVRGRFREVSQRKSPLFYGWIVLAISFITIALSRGLGLSFGVFLVALVEEFGWSRGSIAFAASLSWMVLAVFSPVGGIFLDRFGPRPLFTLGTTIFFLGIFGTSQITELWTLYLFFGVIAAIGPGLLSPGVVTAVLAAWFHGRRGLIFGVALGAWGVGALALAPLSQLFVTKFGYRMGLMLLTLLVALPLIPLNALFQRHPVAREDRAQEGSGRGPAEGRGQVVDPEWAAQEWTLGRAMKTYRLWSLWSALIFGFVPFSLIIVHQIPALVDAGYPRLLAATIFGIFSISNSAGQVFWGFLSDRVGREVGFTLGSGIALAGIVAIMFVRDVSAPWLVYAHAILFGFGQASRASIFSTTSADLFHGNRFGSINGFIFSGQGVGYAIAPWLGGYIYDTTGSYRWAFLLAMGCVLLSCILLWVTAPRKVKSMRRRIEEALDIGEQKGSSG